MKTIYKKIKEITRVLCIQWKIFNVLYSQSRDIIRLLNETSGLFFKQTQHAYVNNIIRLIGILSDPEKSCGQKTISIESLLNGTNKNDEIFKQKKNRFYNSCERIRNLRNRKIAHYDYKTASGVAPLPEIPLNDINRILELLFDVVNYYESTYFYKSRKYSDFPTFQDSIRIDGLINKLKTPQRVKS